MIYLALSAIFVAVALIVAGVVAVLLRRRPGRRASAWTVAGAVGATVAVLVVLTAIFDNLMIAAGLFAYSDAHISGLRVGLAPVEDFAYPLAGAILLPSLWLLWGRDRDS